MSVPFLDSIKEPVAVLSRGGKVLEVNPAFASFAGIKKPAVIGTDCRAMEPLGALWNTITESVVTGVEKSERIIFHNRHFEARAVPAGINGDKPHVLVMFKDITTLVALEAEMVKRNRELIIANTLSGAFIGSENMESIYADLLERAMLITELGMGWIVVASEGDFVLKALSGLSVELRERIFGEDFRSFYEKVAFSHDPMAVMEGEDPSMPEAMRSEGVSFFCTVPLRSAGKTSGLLLLASRRYREFDFDFASLISLVGNHLSLIAEKVNLFQETRRLAVTDGLTGLYNSRFFYRMLEAESERTKRFGQSFSVILFDVDDFRKINERLGHQSGDEVLKALGRTLGMSSRRVDIVARYGGEEFGVILPSTPRDAALACAVRLMDVVANAKDMPANITLSGGVATYPDDADSPGALLHVAEIALENAKKEGKKRTMPYKSEMNGRSEGI